MEHELTLETFISFIRESQGININELINENTLLENELGITGDDGNVLIEEIQKHFSLSYIGQDGTIREIFELKDNEYLFNSEGFSIFGWLFTLFGKTQSNIKPLTIGQLYSATVKAKANHG